LTPRCPRKKAKYGKCWAYFGITEPPVLRMEHLRRISPQWWKEGQPRAWALPIVSFFFLLIHFMRVAPLTGSDLQQCPPPHLRCNLHDATAGQSSNKIHLWSSDGNNFHEFRQHLHPPLTTSPPSLWTTSFATLPSSHGSTILVARAEAIVVACSSSVCRFVAPMVATRSSDCSCLQHHLILSSATYAGNIIVCQYNIIIDWSM
jgi:hypothetical protein